MTLSNLIKEIKILSTNGTDEALVLKDDEDIDKAKQGNGKDKGNYYNYNTQHSYYVRNHQKLLEYFHKYYHANRTKILFKKKQYNKQPSVKQHNSEYHKNYYLNHKEELKLKHRKYLKNRKKNNKRYK